MMTTPFLMEAGKTRAKLGGDYPSFTVSRDSQGMFALYANIPFRDSGNATKFQDLSRVNKKDTAWGDKAGKISKIVAIRTSKEGEWLFFGTKSSYTPAKTRVRGGGDAALKLLSPTEWHYIARGPLSKEDAVLDYEVLEQIKNDNDLTGTAVAEFVSPNQRTLLRRLTSQLEAFENVKIQKAESEDAYTDAFSDTGEFKDSRGNIGAYRPFARVTDGKQSRMFRLDYLPIRPPPQQSKLWPGTDGDYEALTHLLDGMRRGHLGLTFMVGERGEVLIPYSDQQPKPDYEGQVSGESVAAYHNYQIMKTINERVGDPVELRELNEMAKYNSTQYGPYRGVRHVELNATTPTGGNMTMRAVNGLLLHSAQHYSNRNYGPGRNTDPAKSANYETVFRDFIGRLGMYQQHLTQRQGGDEAVPDVASFGLFKELVPGRKDMQLVNDFHELTHAMLGSGEFEERVLKAGDKPYQYMQHPQFSYDWRLVMLHNKQNPKDVRGVLIPPFPRTQMSRRQVLLDDIETTYGKDFIISPEKPFSLQGYIYRMNEKYIPKEMEKSLPPERLSVKLDTRTNAKRYRDLHVTNLYGEIDLGGKQGKDSFGRLAHSYMSFDPSMSDERRNYLHTIFQPRYREDEKPDTREEGPAMFTVAGQSEKFKSHEAIVEKTAQAIKHAAEIGDVGGALADALRGGVRVRMDGRERMFTFDQAGIMYEIMDHGNPDDTTQWRPVASTIFNSDGPYMRVLKSISEMIKTGRAEVRIQDNRGRTIETSMLHALRGASFSMEDGGKFRAWHSALQEKVAAAIGDVDGDYYEAMSALMAIPTLQVRPGKVEDKDANTRRMSYLMAYALEINPEHMPPQLAGSEYANILKRVKAGTPFHQAMGMTKHAANNFRKFVKWVRASYVTDVNPNAMMDGENALQLKLKLHAALTRKATQLKQAEGAMDELARQYKPAELEDENQLYLYSDGALTRKYTEKALNMTVRPVTRWIQDTWHEFSNIVAELYGMFTSPVKTFMETIPAALMAFDAAAKVFFQTYFSNSVEHLFRDRPLPARDGSMREVKFTRVRAVARDMIENGLGLKYYSSHDMNKLQRMIATGAYEQAEMSKYGSMLDFKFAPEFVNEDMVLAQVEGERERIKQVGFPSRNGNPKASMGVVIPFIHPERVGLHRGIVDSIKEFGPRGVTIYGDKPDTLPPDLKRWFEIYGNNFRVRKYKSLYKELSKDSRDMPPVGEFKLSVDRDGVVHAHVNYRMASAFDNHRQAYRAAFERELTSNKAVGSLNRDRIEQQEDYNPDDYNPDEQERKIVYTGALARPQESNRQRKMNLIEALFGLRS